MKTINIVRWQTSREDVYADIVDGQVPRVGDACFLYIDGSDRGSTIRGHVQRVEWSIEEYAGRGYNRVLATVHVAEGSPT